MARKLLSIAPLFLAFAAVACATESGGEDDDLATDENMVLDRSVERGVKTIHWTMANGGADEVCVLPKHLPMADYDKDDDESEQELCGYSFYGGAAREADAKKIDVAICPKLSSTNPGTDVHELLPGKTREQAYPQVKRDVDKLGNIYSRVGSVITAAGDVDSLDGESIVGEVKPDAIGIGVAQGPHPELGDHAIWIVILLATKR